MFDFPGSMVSNITDEIKEQIKTKYQDQLIPAADSIIKGIGGVVANVAKMVKDAFNTANKNRGKILKQMGNDVNKFANAEGKSIKNVYQHPMSAPSSDPVGITTGMTLGQTINTKDKWQDVADVVEKVPGGAVALAAVYWTQAINDFTSDRPTKAIDANKNKEREDSNTASEKGNSINGGNIRPFIKK